MGQRFQSVFILPSVDMGEINLKPNPNNRKEKVLIFHNQWLYGKGALNVNLQIMERLKKAIKLKELCGEFAKTERDYKNHFLEDDLIKAINWASLQELHRETKFSENGGFTYETEDEITLGRLLNNQDNNNGFFICKIGENLKISYCFISGLEDTKKEEYKTPREYLKLFYSTKDLKKNGDFKGVEELFKRFKEFKQISKTSMNPIIKEMNDAV